MNLRLLGVGALAVVVIGSSVGVVFSKHQSRKLFVELERLNQERDELNIEWGRLQLEQSSWAAHGRVEQIARERMHMTLPLPGETVIVSQ